MRKSLHAAMAAASMLVGLAGAAACSDYDPLDWDALVEREAQAFKESGIFDFSTTRNVTLSLDYGVPTATNPVWVYTEYPFDGEGALRPGVDADCAFFLSGGKFEGTLSLPAATERVYIVTGGIGLPGLTIGTVQGGMVTFNGGLTRTIESTVTEFNYKYGASQVVNRVVDFADSGWGSTLTEGQTVTVNTATLYVGGSMSWQDVSYKYADGTSWTKALKMGGGSTFLKSDGKLTENPKRVIKFPAPEEAGWVMVHFRHGSPNHKTDSIGNSTETKDDTRSVEVYHLATGSDTPKLLGSGSITRRAGQDLAKDEQFNITYVIHDGTPGDIYVTSTGNLSINGITYVYTNQSGYLTYSDYRYIDAKSSDLVTLNTTPRTDGVPVGDYSKEYDNLVLLYPWSISGKPLVNSQSESTTTSLYTGSGYNYYFYYDASGEPVTSGITLTNSNPMQYKTNQTVYYWAEIDGKKLEYNRTWTHPNDNYSTSSEDDAVTISNTKAGTVTLYYIVKNNAPAIYVNGKTPNSQNNDYNGQQSSGAIPKESDEYPGLDNVYKTVIDFTKAKANEVKDTTYWTVRAANYDVSLLYMTYNDGTTTHKAYFDADGLVETDASGKVLKSDKWFGLQKGNDINQCKSGTITATETRQAYVTYDGKQYGYGLKLTHNRDTDGKEKLDFKIPAGTKARVTVVQDADVNFHWTVKTGDYGSSGDGGNVKPKDKANEVAGELTNVYITTVDAELADQYCTIWKGGGEGHIYLVKVDYIDKYETTTTTMEQTVLKYPNVNDQPLIAIDGFEGIKRRLFNTIWRSTGSKANAKDHFGDYFNEQYTKTDESKNNIRVEDPAGAKLYVTFLGEYDMTSANTFGYYFYPEGSNPDPSTLKKYIVFPNCTSDGYATGRKYKDELPKDDNGNSVYDYTGNNRQFVPLQSGDQVQLMYYDEASGKYTETFPQGTVVGWFVIYNGFDAWQTVNKKGSLTKTAGTVRLGGANNAYEERTQPDTKIYYSNPGWNTSTGQQARCVQFTDEKTQAVALCFEDSYSPDDGHYGKQDKTYDDLIILLSASPNNANIKDPSGNFTEENENSFLSYSQKGIYLFEDIWEGGSKLGSDYDDTDDKWDYHLGTDYDMNDVAVKYNRLFAVIKEEATEVSRAATDGLVENKLDSIKERYTLVNDGGTYTDGFAVRLPYHNIDEVKILKYRKDAKEHFWTQTFKRSEFANNPESALPYKSATAAKDQTDARIEYDATNDVLTLVLFDDINAMSEGDSYEVIYKFDEANRPSLFYTQNSLSTNKQANGTIDENDITEGSFLYGRGAFNPFIIVYDYGVDDEGKRCEIHLPGKTPSNVGRVAGADNNNDNNRWYVARITSLEEGQFYMPFALDLTDPSFVSPHEGKLVTKAYKKFYSWAKSLGTEDTNWFSKEGEDYREESLIGWDWIQPTPAGRP